MSRRSTWQMYEDIPLINLRAEGMSPTDIAKELERTEKSVIARLQYHGAFTIPNAQRCAREERYGKRHVEDIGHRVVDPAICPSIIAARDTYFEDLSRRNLTAMLCGDPPAGRSALEQNRQRELQRQTLPSISAVSL